MKEMWKNYSKSALYILHATLGDCKNSNVAILVLRYGKIRDIDLKTPSRPPSYAFITFEDQRDADDAIRGR